MVWNIGFITIHPKLMDAYCKLGVLRSAAHQDIQFIVQDLRDFAADKHGSVDASPYGGGDGMVMRPDCLANAVEHVFSSWGKKGEKKPRVVLTSPGGTLWTQNHARQWAKNRDDVVFICGRFAGVDQRFIDEYVTDEFSIGDLVLGGGELPSLMMIETALRFVPGVLGNTASAEHDSFGEGMDGLLEHPLYTRPPEWNGRAVPEVLQGGHHEEIERWRRQQSLAKTKLKRPDLIKGNK